MKRQESEVKDAPGARELGHHELRMPCIGISKTSHLRLALKSSTNIDIRRDFGDNPKQIGCCTAQGHG